MLSAKFTVVVVLDVPVVLEVPNVEVAGVVVVVGVNVVLAGVVVPVVVAAPRAAPILPRGTDTPAWIPMPRSGFSSSSGSWWVVPALST